VRLDRVRWGIIGCGDVCEVKSGPAMQKAEGSELVAVMRRDGEKARDYAQRHGVPKWFSNADDLINDPEVNAVYVATPPSSHLEYAVKAAQAGKPVYVEKPMARTHAECHQMIEACQKAGLPLFVAYYRRRLPAFLKVKDLIDSGAIGEMRCVSLKLLHPPSPNDLDKGNLPWRVRPEISGGGYFVDLGSHQFDLLDFLLGPITRVQGHATNLAGLYSAEDTVSASFSFESGVVGTGLWSFVASQVAQTDLTEITGSKGKVSYSTFAKAAVRLETDRGVEEFNLPNPEHIQQPLIQTVVDELRGKGRCPSTAETGARTSWVIDEVLREWRLVQRGASA